MSQSFMARTAAIGLLGVVLTAPTAARAHLEVQTRDNVSFVSGGIGYDERHAMEAMANQFNVRLTMVAATGQFISEAKVLIEDNQGRALVDTVADGPILFASLPPGKYFVRCSVDGQERKRALQVSANRQSRLTLKWPSAE